VHAGQLYEPVHQLRRQAPRPLLDGGAAHRRLERQRFAEGDHRGFVALPEAFEGAREPDRAGVGAVDRRSPVW
jgi:hypothetical protein